jgi:hypothetical protein
MKKIVLSLVLVSTFSSLILSSVAAAGRKDKEGKKLLKSPEITTAALKERAPEFLRSKHSLKALAQRPDFEEVFGEHITLFTDPKYSRYLSIYENKDQLGDVEFKTQRKEIRRSLLQDFIKCKDLNNFFSELEKRDTDSNKKLQAELKGLSLAEANK